MFKNTNILIGGLLFIFCAVANAEPVVSLSESVIKSKVGATVSVDLLMSDFSMTEGGGVEMHYNPALVRINSIIVDGSTWNFARHDGDINNTDGSVSGILFSNYRGVSGDAKIATIELEFIRKGRGKIRLSESDSNPFASNGEQMAVTFNPTKIRVRRSKHNRK